MRRGCRARDLGVGFAADINNRGQVVGASGRYAFFWDAGQTTLIGPLPGDSWAQGVVINEAGQVGGISVLSTPDQYPVHAYRWQVGVLEPTSLTYQSEPDERLFGMNVNGLAVGERGRAASAQPVAWDNGVTWTLPGSGTPGSGTPGRAVAVNARGDVVGSAATATGTHAALWRRNPAIPAVAAVPSP